MGNMREGFDIPMAIIGIQKVGNAKDSKREPLQRNIATLTATSLQIVSTHIASREKGANTSMLLFLTHDDFHLWADISYVLQRSSPRQSHPLGSTPGHVYR